MKKIVFDTNPLGNFLLSAEGYQLYFKKKFNQEVFFYTRIDEGYVKLEKPADLRKMTNRVITYFDLGAFVSKIPFSKEVRVAPISEEQESDEVLIEVVNLLGERASWKNSALQVIEVEE